MELYREGLLPLALPSEGLGLPFSIEFFVPAAFPGFFVVEADLEPFVEVRFATPRSDFDPSVYVIPEVLPVADY